MAKPGQHGKRRSRRPIERGGWLALRSGSDELAAGSGLKLAVDYLDYLDYLDCLSSVSAVSLQKFFSAGNPVSHTRAGSCVRMEPFQGLQHDSPGLPDPPDTQRN